MTKGAKTFDDLGKQLSKNLRFKKFRIRVEKRRFKLEGEVNPWVLLASGEVKFVDQKDLTRKSGSRLGDNVIYKPKGAAKGRKATVIGEKNVGGKGSDFVERYRGDKKAGKELYGDLMSKEGKSARKQHIKGESGKTYDEYLALYGKKVANTIENRHKLASGMGKKPYAKPGFDDFNAHHRIPVEAIEKSDLLREAIEKGFKFNSDVNGSWVRRYSNKSRTHPDTGKILASPEGIHASHKTYNRQVIKKLNEIESRGYDPDKVVEIVESLSKRLGKKIDNPMEANELFVKKELARGRSLDEILKDPGYKIINDIVL
ncbi:AHH domain-containing protein [Marinigracilibium pacificum]|uniref:Uncharacterized protein n=1 Tax=Marinigracilibium pacificum TaxID=2729599 RepID=A0A848J1G5_9BACT|nr:AHH domain-containing protein [Marinigracilibium pacificum]NMM49188.1 hypothetical protein [Marinigracilibium pacificum]